MDKRFMMILAVVVLIFGGLFFWQSKQKDNTATDAKPTNHVYGKLDSKVTFMEYADFQCNACQYYSGTIQQVKEKYGDRVKFQHRHLPLAGMHPNAIGASRAAEAASNQGKFWEMYGLLFDMGNWNIWTNAQNPNTHFEGYAKKLNLDLEKFKADFISPVTNDTINADIAEFDKTGIQKATPAFFINGKNIPLSEFTDENNSATLESFSKVIDKYLKEAGISTESAPAEATTTPEETAPAEATPTE